MVTLTRQLDQRVTYVDKLSGPVHRLFELGAVHAGLLDSRVERVGAVDEDDEIERNLIVDVRHWRRRLDRRWAAKTFASDSNVVQLRFCDDGDSRVDVDSEKFFKAFLLIFLKY